jgi:hypothetical protein
MKTRYFAGLMGFVFLVTMAMGPVLAAEHGQIGPKVSVSPSVAPLDRKSKIVIMGSGFNPGQEVFIVLEDSLGVLTGLDVVAVPNERGCWAVVWSMGRYARKKIVGEGVYSIMAADADYNVLGSAPLALADPTKDPKEWPAWAKAAGIKPKKKKKKKK